MKTGQQTNYTGDGARLLAARLNVALASNANHPLYKRLSDSLKALIKNMELMPGELLPSTRELSTALGVSRKTVCRCYDDLLSQKFIRSESGIGTFVSLGQIAVNTDSAKPTTRAGMAGSLLTKYAEQLMSGTVEPTHQGDFPELHFGAPPASDLPVKAWRQVMLEQLRDNDFDQFYYDTEPFGYQPLRAAIAKYLMRSRALKCDAEQLLVFSHALSPLRLFAQIVLDTGDTVVVENPGFPFARRVFESLGAKILAVPVDEHGLCVDALNTIKEPVRVIYVTPSHQDPTGAMMSLSRRKQLLNWAKTNDCLILEDDYDCEFRYIGSTLPALMALGDGENVVYVGDMWKTLFPLVNIGYMVLPANLLNVFKRAQSLGWTKASTSLPFYDQLAVTAFMDQGFFERHIRKTRTTYASRYRNLVIGITRFFGKRVEHAKDSGGMQLLVRFKLAATADTIMQAAANAGLSLVPTQTYYVTNAIEKEFLLAFVMIEESDMLERLKRLSESLLG